MFQKMADAAALLKPWFIENARSMPWRDDPTLYHTWVSEIMLQQTRVDTVIPYYLRFIEALPDIKALSACPDDRLMKLWEGLGYYSRVRNLQKAARTVEERYGGKIPENKEELMKLPGIGAYTAGAISSIAAMKPVPVVDGNVLRVVSRILGDFSDITKDSTKAEYAELLEKVLTETGISPRIFNQSLMELGALVCIPNGEPHCADCPVKEICTAALEGKTGELPVKSPKKARTLRKLTVLILVEKDSVFIQKNSQKGLLSGLYGYPVLDGSCDREEITEAVRGLGFDVHSLVQLKPGKHIFTHIEWQMDAWFVRADEVMPSLHPELIRADQTALTERYAMARAFQKWEKERKELMK